MADSYRALQCSALQKDFPSAISALSLARLPSATAIGEHEVRLQVLASSLNFFDLLMLVGRYQHKPKLPFVPGNEAAGIVTEVGAAVKHLSVGDEVAVAMSPSGMAEEIVVPAAVCLPKPPNFTFAETAAYFVGFCTAYHGLVQRGNLAKGETLLVTGAAGGMGSIAVLLGKLLGAIVIAAASTDEKLAACRQMGADYTVNYEVDDLNQAVKKITNGKGADVVYEIVGGDVFDKCTRCTGSEGRLLVIGFAGGRIPKVPANLPLVKGYSVVGVRAGAMMMLKPSLAQEMFLKARQWGEAGVLVPPPVVVADVQRDNKEEAEEKIRGLYTAMVERKLVGKAVVQWQARARARM